MLEDRFAYSQPLRLALLSLAQGRPELLAEAEPPPLTVLPETEAPRGRAAQAAGRHRRPQDRPLRLLRHQPRRGAGAHRRPLRPAARRRRVVPHRLLPPARGERTFRLSRIRSRVTHATRGRTTSRAPTDFDLGAYRDRPAWQLARPPGRRASASPRTHGLVGRGALGALRHDERQDDGGIVYSTAVRRRAAAARLGARAGRRGRAARAARSCARGCAGQLRRLERPARRRPPQRGRRRHGERAGRAAQPRGAGAGTPTTGAWRSTASRASRPSPPTCCRAAARTRPCSTSPPCAPTSACRPQEAARRRPPPQPRQLRRRRHPPLRRVQGPRGKLSVSCDLAGPPSRGRRASRRCRPTPCCSPSSSSAASCPTASGAALASAADKLRAARGTPRRPSSAGDLLCPPTRSSTPSTRPSSTGACSRIEYWTEGTDEVSRRTVEPYLLVHSRGEWYYVCWCRTAAGTRVFRVATTKSARLLDETFEPRPEVELELYRREGIPASGSYAPQTATVWYSPVVRRWIDERQPVRRAGGRLVPRRAALRGRALALPPPAALRRPGAPAGARRRRSPTCARRSAPAAPCTH